MAYEHPYNNTALLSSKCSFAIALYPRDINCSNCYSPPISGSAPYKVPIQNIGDNWFIINYNCSGSSYFGVTSLAE
ncbi:MAG TPA: hypothetical protein VH500_15105 [Nitrososphaeraceae archaeon]